MVLVGFKIKRKENHMKTNKKFTVCTMAAVLGIMSAVPAAAFADWSTDEKNRIFYYAEDGSYLTGEQEIDGEKYLFSANGVLKTGWRTVDGQRRYFDPKTGKSVSGWLEYCGKEYYIDSENGKVTGYFMDENNSPHIMSDKGNVVTETGFTETDGKTYYINPDGTLLTGKNVIDDDTYFFDDNGIMSVGIVMTGEKEGFLFGDDGKMLTGWQDYNDNRYYLGENGAMYFDWQTIDDNKYYFSGEGVMVSGITEIDGKKYYFSTDGVMLTGWQTVDETEYYFLEDGAMASGITEIDGNRYYFSSDGIRQTGWTEDGDKKYYCDNDGKIMTGWQTVDDTLHYLMEDGTLAHGLVSIPDDATYYFDENGTKQTGWITVNSNQCYFNEDGKMVFGWQTIDGSEYFFDNYGIMKTNTTIDGKVLGADGKVQAISAVQQRANSVIAQIGTSTEAIYSFVRNNNRYSHMEETKSQAQIEAIGWSYFANYAFDNRFIVCYYYAAITDLLYKQAGYESRIVHGTGRGSGEHYWNEIKINGYWTCIDTCNGYFQVSFSYLQSQNYTFYNYVYPTYN